MMLSPLQVASRRVRPAGSEQRVRQLPVQVIAPLRGRCHGPGPDNRSLRPSDQLHAVEGAHVPRVRRVLVVLQEDRHPVRLRPGRHADPLPRAARLDPWRPDHVPGLRIAAAPRIDPDPVADRRRPVPVGQRPGRRRDAAPGVARHRLEDAAVLRAAVHRRPEEARAVPRRQVEEPGAGSARRPRRPTSSSRPGRPARSSGSPASGPAATPAPARPSSAAPPRPPPRRGSAARSPPSRPSARTARAAPAG